MIKTNTSAGASSSNVDEIGKVHYKLANKCHVLYFILLHMYKYDRLVSMDALILLRELISSTASADDRGIHREPLKYAKGTLPGPKIVIVRSTHSPMTDCQRMKTVEPEKDSLSTPLAPLPTSGKGNTF